MVETVAACIEYPIKSKWEKEMMPMNYKNILFFNFVKKAASFAAYTISLLITQDASAATALL